MQKQRIIKLYITSDIGMTDALIRYDVNGKTNEDT